MTTQPNTKAPKKEKLFVEEDVLNHILKTRRGMIDHLNEFSGALNREGITLTNEILSLFIQTGYPVITDLLISQTKEDLARLKIQGQLITESLFEEAEKLAREQFGSYQRSIQTHLEKCQISADELTIEDGQAIFTKQEQDRIREQFTYYLAPENKELYDRLLAFTESYNELFAWLSQKGNPGVLDRAVCTALTQENLSDRDERGVRQLNSNNYLINDITPEGRKLKPNPKYFAYIGRPSKAFVPSPRDEKPTPQESEIPLEDEDGNRITDLQPVKNAGHQNFS